MRRGNSGSVSLSAVEAFLATAAAQNYGAAGDHLGVSATTVMRRLRSLELWLYRVLIDDHDLSITDDGDDFTPVADQVLKLAKHDGIDDMKKLRIHGDGTLTIEGEQIRTTNAALIGNLLVKHRADPSKTKPAPEPISANDPLIIKFLEEYAAKQG